MSNCEDVVLWARSMEPSTSREQGSSPTGHGGQEQIGLAKWNPKHKIFLSHSGKQKEFVRQLCKDLEAETHEPFLDDRPSSLMMGKPFAPLIFEAARQCLVAVVVLSEDFLTSKWPMLELVEFVKAKKSHNPELKLFPVFYKLSPDDLKAEAIEIRWKSAWAEMTSIPVLDQVMPPDATRRQFDLRSCMEAIRELCGTNGPRFQNFASELAYREAIVKQISLLVPPDFLDDALDVIGNERLCKVFAGMFVEDTAEDSNLRGTQKLGLYGVGGIGKTTMSRALCKFFSKDFNGRVCHVELGSMPAVDLQKFVLTKLLRMGKDVVERVHMIDTGRKLLRDHMKRQPVFLVIDNITNDGESQYEESAYLEAGFHPGSKIMITARSRVLVERAFNGGPNCTYCKAMGSLSEEEAGCIFLRRAAPQRKLETLTSEEQEILKVCLGQCRFSSEDGEMQYHPLALQALADYYHEQDNLNMLKWKEHLDDLDKLRLSSESSDIFGVLGLQFSRLGLKTKLLFLDVALYSDGGYFRTVLREHVRWLADIHEDTPRAVEFQLQSLRRSDIINITPLNEVGDQFITIHDVYKEFAKWYVRDGEGSRCTELGCIYQEGSTDSLPYVLNRTSPSNSQLQRIWLSNLKCATLPSKKVQEWCNVVVLQIHECPDLKVLHLHGLSCLRHLELTGLWNLETFHFKETVSGRSKGSNDTLESLLYVKLSGLLCLKQLPDFRPCPLLKSFKMYNVVRFLSGLPSFKDCSQLEYLRLEWNLHWPTKVFNLNTLTSLTSLYIEGADFGTYSRSTKKRKREVDLKRVGLDACTQLQELVLNGLPITSLPGLEQLTKLRELSITGCETFRDIANVSALAQLEVLDLSCTGIKGIPGVEKLLQLRHLICQFCSELTRLPDLDHLPKLSFVSTYDCQSLELRPRVPPHCVYSAFYSAF